MIDYDLKPCGGHLRVVEAPLFWEFDSYDAGVLVQLVVIVEVGYRDEVGLVLSNRNLGEPILYGYLRCS